jgi:lysophospholipase L1-like esterase
MRASLRLVATIAATLVVIALAGAARGEQVKAGPTLHNSASAVGVFEFVMIGDSIMAPSPGNAEELSALITAAGVPNHFTNLAVGGLTCADWNAPGALDAAINLHANLYLVNCGTNDAKFPNLLAAADGNLHSIYVKLLNGTPGTRVLPHYIQYNAGWTGRQSSEGAFNDAVYRQTTSNIPAGLIIPAIGLGFIPETTLVDGGHPGHVGYVLTANFQYRTLRAIFAWPDIAPVPCGMDGHRINDTPYPQGTYIPFNGACWSGWVTS